MREVPQRIDMTIEGATDAWLARYSSANTRAAYASDLRAFLAWFGDDSSALAVTPETVHDYRAERESSGVSQATVDRQFTALRGFYATVRDAHLRGASPMPGRTFAIASPRRRHDGSK